MSTKTTLDVEAPPAKPRAPSGDPLRDRYAARSGKVLISGVQALARLPLDALRIDAAAGLSTRALLSGYQGSPLGGYDLELGRQRELLAAAGAEHRPAVNEELAATALAGSQMVEGRADASCEGVIGLWYGKAPGLDRAGDALRHGNLMGASAHGGVLVAVGDDANAKSSTVPSGSEIGLHNLALPVLSPSGAAAVLELGLHGIAMSRSAGCWVGMKISTAAADGYQTVDLDGLDLPAPPDRAQPPLGHRVSARVLGAELLEMERSLFAERLDRAREYGVLNQLNRITHSSPGDELGIVVAGSSYLDLISALRALGIGEEALAGAGIRVLEARMLYPLDAELLRDFAGGLDEVVVVEEKRSFLEGLVVAALYGGPQQPPVYGKSGPDGAPLLPAGGELTAVEIATAIGARLLARREDEELRQRLESLRGGTPIAALEAAPAPYFCSGCPHNTSTKVPDGAIVGGGIGCHGMAVTMGEAQVGEMLGLTQMGGEGGHWIGLSPFVSTPHLFQNLGDGTYAHSGSLAIRGAVGAGANITYKLLYNSTVAMTGGQTAIGQRSVADLTHILQREGVRRIIVTVEDPGRYRGVDLAPGTEVWDRTRIIEAQEALAAVEGVTVLIHDQQCATELRRDRKRGRQPKPESRIFINERVCEGCGDCGEKSNCLSVRPIETEFGRKTQIHQASCNKDDSCVEGDCPSFLEVVPGKQAEATTPPDPGPIAEPESRAGETVGVRYVGLGGTGIVTAAQVLAVAALEEGFEVRGLDQTGLAQKAGLVVSDVRISSRPLPAASRLGEGECDVYLACDLVAGAQPTTLAVADPGQTVALVNEGVVPTGRQVSEVDAPATNGSRMRRRIAGRASIGASFDADAICAELFGSDQFANVMLLGAAFQSGRLPVTAVAIERAIERNGVAVELNQLAFRWGRRLFEQPGSAPVVAGDPARASVSKPGRQARELVEATGAPAGGELEQLLLRRVDDLIGYQRVGYAREYLDAIDAVLAAESQLETGESLPLTEAAARNLHKLMAYKDEYEVARLHLDPVVAGQVEETFGAGAKVALKLHPPALRALGMKRKLTIRHGRGPLLRTLRAGRRLRGTPIDPFGWAKVRRVERELIREYRAALAQVAAGLREDRVEQAVAVAEAPELVRGYEQIKLDSVERYRAELSRRLAPFPTA